MDKKTTYQIEKGTKDKKVKRKYWDIAIGLQDVDGLKPSNYLKELAETNIDGRIDNENIEQLLYTYYKSEGTHEDSRTMECDIVSNRIVELLDSQNISFSPATLKSIHRYLFHDIYEDAGVFRTYNISKEEPILNGNTVKYANYYMIEDTLDYDFTEEKKQKYSTMSQIEVIKRISKFTSSVWQVHPFTEGNTRTTAVFIERYLNSVGFRVNNNLFKENSLYFRNALVRSNYADLQNSIDTENIYLERFFENLLYGGTNRLESRELYGSGGIEQ